MLIQKNSEIYIFSVYTLELKPLLKPYTTTPTQGYQYCIHYYQCLSASTTSYYIHFAVSVVPNVAICGMEICSVNAVMKII